MANTENTDVARREALKKLAKLSAYTAPSVLMLLSASTGHAQSSAAIMNLNNGQISSYCMSLGNLGGELGNDTGGAWGGWVGGDTSGDCT